MARLLDTARFLDGYRSILTEANTLKDNLRVVLGVGYHVCWIKRTGVAGMALFFAILAPFFFC